MLISTDRLRFHLSYYRYMSLTEVEVNLIKDLTNTQDGRYWQGEVYANNTMRDERSLPLLISVSMITLLLKSLV